MALTRTRSAVQVARQLSVVARCWVASLRRFEARLHKTGKLPRIDVPASGPIASRQRASVRKKQRTGTVRHLWVSRMGNPLHWLRSFDMRDICGANLRRDRTLFEDVIDPSFAIMPLRKTAFGRITAILLAALVAFTLSPTVMAMSTPRAQTAGSVMAMNASCATFEKAAYLQEGPQQHQGPSCEHGGICSDMASCSVAAALPTALHIADPAGIASRPLLHQLDDWRSATLQPDDPPPIA